MTHYTRESWTRNNSKRIWIFVIWKKSFQQISKTIIGYCHKNRTTCSKNCNQKVAHEAAEPTAEFIRNKIANKIVKPNPVSNTTSGNAEGMFIPPEKKGKILHEW